VLNLTDEQLIGKYNVFKDPQVEEQGILNVVRDTLEKGKTTDYTLQWSGKDTGDENLKDSNTVYCEGTVFPIFDQLGKITNAVITYKDVSDRKEAEKELEISQRLLRNTIDNMPGSVWWKDLDSVFLGCNLSFTKDAGLDHPDQLISKSDYDMIWKDQADHYVSDDREVIESGLPKIGIHEIQTKPDGSIRWLETNKVPLQDNEGNIIGTVGTYLDITERKQAEDEINQHRANLKALIENTKDMIWSIDRNYCLLTANTVFLKHIEPLYKEILPIGSLLLDKKRLPRELYNEWKKNYDDVFAGRKLNMEYETPDVTGKDITLDISYNPIYNEKNDIVGISIFGTDITKRKLTEEELAKHREHLEELVVERTKELEKRNKELESIHKNIVGREFRIKELRDQVKELKARLGDA